jgi:hypothetical protein
MIEKKPQQVDTNREHRRRGNAFDTLSNVLRNVKELVFRNGLVMRNRPSEVTDSKNVFEMYAENDPEQGYNFVFIGRNGLTERADTRNMSYIELTADSDTTKTSQTGNNGTILLVLSKDKTQDGYAQISLANGTAFVANGTGTRASINGEGDGTSNDIGGSQLAYKNNTSGSVIGISVDKEGIQMAGLPTSASGLAVGTIWRDGTTLKIVT